MTQALRGLIGKCCVVYLDDILIYSTNPEEHLEHIELVLQRLREHRMFARLRKCEFNQQEIKYLGHIINAEGRRPDPSKVEVVQRWPQPKNVHEIRSFLGLTNFFRKYMRGYAKIATPLHNLTKKDVPYVWTENCEKAFQELKENLMSAPILALPDSKKLYTVISDACNVSGGAILMQGDKVVAYWGKKWANAEIKFSVGEQELLAVVDALKEWRCYLEGKQVDVITDHNPLIWLQTQPNLSRRQAGWVEYLQRFHIQWKYRPGKKNVADPISRAPSLSTASTCTTMLMCIMANAIPMDLRRATRRGIIGEKPRPPPSVEKESEALPPPPPRENRTPEPVADDESDSENLETTVPDVNLVEQAEHERQREEIREDFLKQVAGAYSSDPWFKDENINREKLVKHAGLWWKDQCLAIPADTQLREQVLRICHDAPWSGHLGRDKTRELVSSTFWWPTFTRDIDKYVNECHSCQRNKPKRKKPLGYLHPLAIPRRRFEWVAVDFITDLPVTQSGNDCIVVFADRLSKYVKFVPTKLKGLTATVFAGIFRRTIDSEFGTPLYLTSDRDPRFTGTFWTDVCKAIGIKRRMSTAFHPQTNGQVEHVNGTLEEMLRHYVSPAQDDWDEHIDQCQKAYNNAWHPSIGCSPAEMLYGQRLLNVQTAQIVSRNPNAMTFAGEWHKRCARAKSLLVAAQQRQAMYYNKKRRNVEDEHSFEEGGKVLVDTRNIRLLVQAKNKETRRIKLLPRYMGPFEVKEKVNEVAYRVKLPEKFKVHDVFHISLLHPYKESGRVQPPPPPIEIDGEWGYEVEEILNERIVRRNRRECHEFYVQWKGSGAEHNTWEPEQNLINARQAIADFRAKKTKRTVV